MATGPGQRPWVLASLAALAATAVLPILLPATADVLQRTTPLFSLFFFLAAIGHWLRMGNRAFAVAGAMTLVIYGITAWTPSAFGLEDFFVIALLSSLLVFALAGFNAVFILEEMMYDIQRLSHFRHPLWRFVPTLAVLALAWGLPALSWTGMPFLRTLWIVAIVHSVILGGWWFVRAFNPIPEGPVLKELHLIVAGTSSMAALIDVIRTVRNEPGIFPSVLAYLVLIGTWFYVSYTTLQRTRFLMGRGNATPWLLILMSASFAIIQHAFLHYNTQTGLGIAFLLNQRLGYVIFGIGVGMAVYLVQALWRIFRSLRDERTVSPTGRIIAGRLARIAESLLSAEQRVIEGTAASVYRGVDRLLPGRREDEAWRPTGWELDHRTGTLRRFGDSEE